MADEATRLVLGYLRQSDTVMRRIGIGGDLLGRSPATPPGMRVRTGRFEKLRS